MPLLMTSERLKAIRKRESKASVGPWLTPAQAGGADNVTVLDHEGCDVWPWERVEDMEFAYSARADVPDLLSHNDALVEVIRQATNGVITNDLFTAMKAIIATHDAAKGAE